MRTIVQLPLEKSLKIKAKKYVTDLGFNSLQSYLRFILIQTVTGRIQITFEGDALHNIGTDSQVYGK